MLGGVHEFAEVEPSHWVESGVGMLDVMLGSTLLPVPPGIPAELLTMVIHTCACHSQFCLYAV